MKKIISAITLVALISLASCSGKKSNALVGKWKVMNIELPKVDLTSNTSTNLDSAGIKGVDTAVKAMSQGVEQMANAFSSLGEGFANGFMKGSTYDFKNDGSLSISLLLGSQEGSYTVSADSKSVTMKMDGKDEEYSITSINDKSLVLTSTKGDVWTFEAK